MAKVVVLGGGVCGLAAALMLARDGHAVTVLERDAAPVPRGHEEAWERWSRGGVAQFRQPHYLQPRGRVVLDEELPDVRDGLLAAGAARFSALGLMPPSITDRAARDGDHRFETVTARRPVLEAVFGEVADREPALEVRRGVHVRGLLARRIEGTPHVLGVRTEGGERIAANLVVDATGRGSRLPQWLGETGADPLHDEPEPAGFVYYTRFFRARDGGSMALRVSPVVPIGSFSLLVLPGDNGTWSVTVYISPRDQPLKRLRDDDRWMALLRACRAHTHLVDAQPLTGVIAMGGLFDRRRRLVVDGRPIATGVVTIGDAWACTNPSHGRGLTLGLLQAQRLRDVVRSHGDDPPALAEAWDAITEAELMPWYRETVQAARDRLGEIDALRRGVQPPTPRDRAGILRAALPAAAMHDAEVFRAILELRACITPPEALFARPGLAARIIKVALEHERPAPPGPDREQLLRLLADSENGIGVRLPATSSESTGGCRRPRRPADRACPPRPEGPPCGLLGVRHLIDRGDEEVIAMLARVTTYEGGTADGIRAAVRRLRANISQGAPPGVRSSGLTLLADPLRGRVVFIGLFATAEDLGASEPALRAENPPRGIGRRSSVEVYEVGTDFRL